MPERIVDISLTERDKVDEFRTAVDAYREAHRLLHSVPWHKGVPEEHTPLLIKLKKALVKLGYKEGTELSGAFADSEAFNVKELGFTDKADFDAKAKEADIVALEEMWE